MSKIIYGKGKLSIEPVSDIRAFDIKYSGEINANILLSSNWVVMCKKNRIIGFSTSLSSISNSTDIMEYTGYFKIKSCLLATQDDLIDAQIVDNATHFFNGFSDTFSSSTTEFDNANDDYQYKRKRMKNRILQKKLITKEDEYYYESGNKVQEGIEYHIESERQQAKIGPPGIGEGTNIFKRLANKKLYTIKSIKHKPKKFIDRKMKKKYVAAIKAKASSGRRGFKKGPGPHTPQGTAYTGGGSE